MSSSPEYSPFFAVMGASAAMVFSGNYHTISPFTFEPILTQCRCCVRVFLTQFCISRHSLQASLELSTSTQLQKPFTSLANVTVSSQCYFRAAVYSCFQNTADSMEYISFWDKIVVIVNVIAACMAAPTTDVTEQPGLTNWPVSVSLVLR